MEGLQVETSSGKAAGAEFEIRGGWWEGLHVLVFYTAVTCAVLSTLGVARLATGIAAVVLLFYSILAIFSSPTYLVVDGESRALVLERYRFFIPFRRRLARQELESLELEESPYLPGEEGEGEPGGRLSYRVRLHLLLKDGREMKLFRSGLTGSPSDNRTRAFLIAETLSRQLGLPVNYRQAEAGDHGAGE